MGLHPTTTNERSDQVLIDLSHAGDDPEAVLVAYLMGVGAFRAGRRSPMWLTRDAVTLGLVGGASRVHLPGAPFIEDLHDEYVGPGGLVYACAPSVHLRALTNGPWIRHAEVQEVHHLCRYLTTGGRVFTF